MFIQVTLLSLEHTFEIREQVVVTSNLVNNKDVERIQNLKRSISPYYLFIDLWISAPFCETAFFLFLTAISIRYYQ